MTINLTSELIEIKVYSADIAQEAYEENLRAKGQELKIGSNIELVNKIEKMIKEEKESPEVIEYELKQEGLTDITGRTIRNYIYDGNVFNLTEEDMIYNKKHKIKNKNKRISKHTPPEKSIENRPKEANDRSEYGHWERGFNMSKLSYEDKINIYKDKKNGMSIKSLSCKYKIRTNVIIYLTSLIDKHGLDILRTSKNKIHTKYEKQEAIDRVLVNGEAKWSVALDMGLLSKGILDNWISNIKKMVIILFKC